MKRFAILGACWLVACDMSPSAPGGDEPDDDSDGSDAVDGGDAPGCEVYLDVAEPEVEVDGTIVADLSWEGVAGDGGVTWSVEDPHENVFTGFEVIEVGPGSFRLVVPARQAGTWEIRARVDDCGAEETRLAYARAAGAGEARYRLRFHPRPESGLAAFEDETTVVVPSGGPRELRPLDWPASRALDGLIRLVRDGSSLPLAAQLSLRPERGGLPVVLHADEVGRYQGSIPYGSYEVVIVPYEAEIAPAKRSLDAFELEAGFTIETGQPVTGWVKDAAGNPVASRVALAAAGMPASIVHTEPDGSFSGFAHAPGELEVRVTPDDHDKLGLLADASLDLVPGELDIRLPEVAWVDVEVTVTSSADVVLPGASVRAISAGTGGTVQQAGVTRTARRTGRRSSEPTDADGKVTLRLPAGPYTLVVEPPEGGSDTMASQEIVVVGPGVQKLKLKSAQRTSATLRLSGGDPGALAGTQVIAVSRGLLGLGAGTSVAGAPSEVQPTFALSLVPGVAYDVLVVPRPGSGLLRRTVTIVADAADEIPVVLSRGVELRGQVLHPGSAQPVKHARVTAVCAACDDPDRELAETSTGSSGTFRLQVPDPGPKTP